MNQEPFEKLDREFDELLKVEREKGVSPGMLRGFSASVESKILQKQERKVRPFIAPVLVPAFAVMLLASLVIFNNHSFQAPSPKPYMNMLLTSTADLTEEISALQELGVWGEEDEEVLEVSDLEVAPE